MNQWKVTNKEIGEITINAYKKINKAEEYAVKSLAMLQIVCMNPEDKDKFTQFLEIIDEATTKANELYGKDDISCKSDPAEFFR
jgi:hypothetical protein